MIMEEFTSRCRQDTLHGVRISAGVLTQQLERVYLESEWCEACCLCGRAENSSIVAVWGSLGGPPPQPCLAQLGPVLTSHRVWLASTHQPRHHPLSSAECSTRFRYPSTQLSCRQTEIHLRLSLTHPLRQDSPSARSLSLSPQTAPISSHLYELHPTTYHCGTF